MTNRIVIFAHFDRDHLIDDYVIYYIRALKELSKAILFVSSSSLSGTEISKVGKLCDKVSTRHNIGYDFMSWKAGLDSIRNLSDYDELILCNDSVYGPLFSLQDLFQKMKGKADFWGITASQAKKKYHIQTYFLVFTPKVFLSDAFQIFFAGIQPHTCKEKVVESYEVQLTRRLHSCGFTHQVYIDNPATALNILDLKLTQIRNRGFYPVLKKLISISSYQKDRWTPNRVNTTMLLWKKLIQDHHMPFVKVSVLRDNPGTVDINDYNEFIRCNTEYDPELIRNHLLRLKESVPG